jgi:hypothetical protein
VRKLLYILFLFVCFKSIGQTQTISQTFVDRCTGETTIATANFVNGSAVVAFYSRVKTFTWAEYTNGTLEAWLNETYAWWSNLSPCSTNTATNQTTQQTTTNATSSATNAATNAASTTGGTTNTTTGTASTNTGSTSTGSTNTSNGNTNTGNGSTNSNSSSSSSSSGSSDSSNSSSSGNDSTGGGDDQSNNSSSGSEGDSGGESENTSSGGESEGDTSNDSKEDTSDTNSEESTEEESSTESESSEDSESEESESEEVEEESSEESEEESSEEESSEEEEKEEKKEEKKKRNPIAVAANIMTQSGLDGRLTQAASFGFSQSSLTGTTTYSANAMIWDNLKQFSLSLSKSDVYFNYDREEKLFLYNPETNKEDLYFGSTYGKGSIMVIQSVSANFMYIYGTKVASFGLSNVYLGQKENFWKGFVGGYALSGTIINVDDTVMIMPSGVLFGTKPFPTKRVTISPMLALAFNPVSYTFNTKEKTLKGDLAWNEHITYIVGSNFDVGLTQRFRFNIGGNIIGTTLPGIPLTWSATIGSKFQF